MQNIDKERLEEQFIDVRKAYRLLYHYQRRVIDLAYFIGNYYNMDFISGNPWFSGATFNRTSVSQKRWAWDWLGMYFYDFYFEKEFENQKKIQLGVIIQSDTGYFDSKDAKKLNLKDYAKPEESETRLILAVSQGNWDSKEIRETKFFSKELEQYPPTYEKSPKKDLSNEKIIAKAYSLSDFIDEQSTIENLIDFRKFCNGLKIYLPEEDLGK